MDPVHETLTRLLEKFLWDTPYTVQSVLAWWEHDRQPDEPLVAYLTRHGVLTGEAQKTLQFIARGDLSPSCQHGLLSMDGLHRLLDAMRPADPPPPPPRPTGTYRRPTVGPPFSDTLPSANPGLSKLGSKSSTRPLSAVPAAGTVPATGTVLSRYLLLEKIGQGTSGVAFRALNQTLNLTVAVKLLGLPGDGQASPAAVEALQTEARMMASINHPNVVRLWDCEADPACPFLVMECVEGSSLAELIQQSGRIACERAIDILTQIVDGLDALWRLGLVHRDIKPHNILLTRHGVPTSTA